MEIPQSASATSGSSFSPVIACANSFDQLYSPRPKRATSLNGIACKLLSGLHEARSLAGLSSWSSSSSSSSPLLLDQSTKYDNDSSHNNQVSDEQNDLLSEFRSIITHHSAHTIFLENTSESDDIVNDESHSKPLNFRPNPLALLDLAFVDHFNLHQSKSPILRTSNPLPFDESFSKGNNDHMVSEKPHSSLRNWDM